MKWVIDIIYIAGISVIGAELFMRIKKLFQRKGDARDIIVIILLVALSIVSITGFHKYLLK